MLTSAAHGICQWPSDITDTIETVAERAIEKLNEAAANHESVKEEELCLQAAGELSAAGTTQVSGIVEDRTVTHAVTLEGTTWHITVLVVGTLRHIYPKY